MLKLPKFDRFTLKNKKKIFKELKFGEQLKIHII